jgi:hypothetical protein
MDNIITTIQDGETLADMDDDTNSISATEQDGSLSPPSALSNSTGRPIKRTAAMIDVRQSDPTGSMRVDKKRRSVRVQSNYLIINDFILEMDSRARQQGQQCHQNSSRLYTPRTVLQVHHPPLPRSCIPLLPVEHLYYWCAHNSLNA